MKIAIPFANSPILDDVTWRRMARLWRGDGVVPPGDTSAPAYASALAVTADASGFNVRVGAGEAWVDGGYYAEDTQRTVPINAPDATNPRIDLVVLRWDGPLATADPVVLQGTPAGVPVAPTPTQNRGGRWEEVLGEVRVNTGATNIAAPAVTDRRRFALPLGASGARQNLLVNPDFGFWQRGGGPYTVSGRVADKWQIYSGGGTIAVAQDTTNADLGSVACLAMTTTGLGAGQEQSVYQTMEDFAKLRGKIVSLSLRIKTTATVYVEIVDSAGSTAVNVPGNGQWQTVSVTRVIASATGSVQAQVRITGNGVTYLNKAMLVMGATPVDYAPRPAGQDLALCQQYYEIVLDPGSGSFVIGGTAAAAGATFYAYVPWKVPKAVVPAVTKVGTWTTANAGQPTANTPDKQGCYLNLTSTAGGTVYATNSAAGNTLIADTGL